MSCACYVCIELKQLAIMEEVESSESESELQASTTTSESDEEQSDWTSEEGSISEEEDCKDLLMSGKHLATYRSYFVFKPKNNKRNRTSITEEKTVEALDQNLIVDLNKIVNQFSQEIWKVEEFDMLNVIQKTLFFSCKELADFHRAQRRCEQVNVFIPYLCWLKGKIPEQYDMMFLESFLPLEKYLDSYQILTTENGTLQRLFFREIYSISSYKLKESAQNHIDEIVETLRCSMIYKRFFYLFQMDQRVGIPETRISQVQYSDNTIREAFNKRQKQQAD